MEKRTVKLEADAVFSTKEETVSFLVDGIMCGKKKQLIGLSKPKQYKKV